MSKSLVSEQSYEKAETELDSQETQSLFKDVLTTIKIGIVNSNLITTFTGLWLALFFTGQSILAFAAPVVFVLAGTALVIAGGCSMNNYIDRDIDPLMTRTQERPSATGKFEAKNVLILGMVLSVAGITLLFAASPTAAAVGFFGLIIYVLVYTMWLKRTYSINTVVGSLAGAVPPLIGWAAIDPSLSSPIPWILFLIMFLWQPPHFLALAIKRVEEYRRAGIPMLPVVAGFPITQRQMIVYVAVLVPASLLLNSLGTFYTASALILGTVWLAYAVFGLFTKDIVKWSRIMFVISLNYLTLLFMFMILATFI
ncbi:protoheme IX farnesyltransferase [Sporolactobacillus shoreae]|uniref:Protoheme IX farnesyltransferase n=1 Tax=Sporolactobacillus shoreae TaxID=1465501 RepID=A0A4Z0GT65_9BACL|nr:heme o synthase [Sporolactobacillus shoreae]TGB00181.1 protoheme IX farnesyltransferase [Sporolactobacillus shoreae]